MIPPRPPSDPGCRLKPACRSSSDTSSVALATTASTTTSDLLTPRESPIALFDVQLPLTDRFCPYRNIGPVNGVAPTNVSIQVFLPPNTAGKQTIVAALSELVSLGNRTAPFTSTSELILTLCRPLTKSTTDSGAPTSLLHLTTPTRLHLAHISMTFMNPRPFQRTRYGMLSGGWWKRMDFALTSGPLDRRRAMILA